MSSEDVVVIGGGQAALATAHTAISQGLRPLVLDAGSGPGGSWPSYYDSLTLFSPARFSALPGFAFPGDPDRYPLRDEVVDYLAAYTARLQRPFGAGQRLRDHAFLGDQLIQAAGGQATRHVKDLRGFGDQLLDGQIRSGGNPAGDHRYGDRVGPRAGRAGPIGERRCTAVDLLEQVEGLRSAS